MKTLQCIFLFSILLFLPSPTLLAQDITIQASVDRDTISLDDQLSYTVTVSGAVGKIPQPELPDFAGFVAYSAGRSSNFSMINGQVSSSVTFSYVLMPTTTGSLTIGPAKLNYKGKVHTTKPITIEVTAASPPLSAPPQAATPTPARPAEGEPEKLFIETFLDKTSGYVNEQLTLTFAFYQAIRLFETPVYSPPSTTGFWTEDLPPQRKYYKTINGVQYLVTEIKTALFPTAPGEFTIGPAELSCTIEDIPDIFDRHRFDIFDIFRGGKPVALRSRPIALEIKPLPDENKPPSFQGDVGSYRISGEVDRTEVEVNSPLTLKIKIEGQGNIKTLTGPVFPDFDGFKVYDQAGSENISKDNYLVQGSKVYEKILIPVKPGEVGVGAIKFSYFDPAAETYRTAETRPFKVKVSGTLPEEEKASRRPARAAKKEIKLITQDINFIKQDTQLVGESGLVYQGKGFWIFNILPIFIWVGALVYSRHLRRLNEDIGYARIKSARRGVKKRLAAAREALRKEDKNSLYLELYKIVASFIADKVNIPSGGITAGEIRRELEARSVDQKLIGKVEEYLKSCDEVRFLPHRIDSKRMAQDLKRAEGIIVQLSKVLK